MTTKSKIALLLGWIFAITGCSEANKTIEPLPPLVEDLSFPFLHDGALYELDPLEGTQSKVQSSAAFEKDRIWIESPENLIIFLDTDQSVEVKTEDDSELKHTVLPEYAIFSRDASIYIFDLHTRKANKLITLTNSDTGSDEVICDLREVVTIDEESLTSDIILYKNEEKVYVKTSVSDCAQEPFNYYQINIVSDPDNSFEVIRHTLSEHDHLSKHEHDHDNTHTHNHAHESGEIGDDGLPFDQNNHLHSHKHSHELQFGDLSEHKYLSKEEIDAVHDDKANIEIEFEQHQELIGRKRISNEALMYSDHPIVDFSNNEFGYLGFDQSNNSYEFYSTDLDTLQKTLVWTLELDDIDVPALSSPREISPRNNLAVQFSYVGNSILFLHNKSLVLLPLLALFDDDQEIERESRFENPLYTFEEDDRFSYSFSSSSQAIFIRDGNKILQITDLSLNGSAELIKTYPSDQIENITLFEYSSLLSIKKDFHFDDKESNLTLSSVVGLSLEQNLETTIINAREQYLKLQIEDDSLLLTTIESDDNSTLEAHSSSSGAALSNSTGLINSIWGLDTDYSAADGEDFPRIILNSEDIVFENIDGRNIPLLSNPTIYEHYTDNSLGHGSLLGTLGSPVAEVIDIDKRSELFGQIYIKHSHQPDAPIHSYFFPYGLSYINPTGEFGNMLPIEFNSEE
jgi:hypothetical protein